MTLFYKREPGYGVLCRLEKAGHEAVFVGGAVRDYLLNREATDIDIATSAEPEEVKKVFPHTFDVGIEHGTVLVVLKGEQVEVTTFRTDGKYTDHRRPDAVKFVKSLTEDLMRRDFTINALAMTKDGKLLDPFNGRLDMEKNLIRAAGDPVERFKEDALRMMRAIRFSSTLNFSIEEKTFQAIMGGRAQLSHVSIERLKIEFDKLFMGINPMKAFNYIEKSSLHLYLPLYPKDNTALIEILPFKNPEEGWAYFAIAGGFSTTNIVKAYKLSNQERKYISSVQEVYVRRVSNVFTIEDYYLFDIDVLKMAERIYNSFYKDEIAISDEAIEMNKSLLRIHSIADVSVDGKDLLDWTGLSGGRWTGEWIGKIEKAVLYGDCQNEISSIKEWFINEFYSKR
ncbi:CCA tRNA nucleotidyltransferase [Sporosarcina sp. FA9]|uniref:CCA tRNA nucleotidyltransferase n=1 Tax=Sporosarcina sp. FA9 TaxID=3413030 RepID=UPI003F656086